MSNKISIVIPIYNEEQNIHELYQRLKKLFQNDLRDLCYEIIFIDDGSTDSSYALLEALHREDPCVKVIKFSRNFGHHIAFTSGLDHATGDYVVMMDGDLQNPPEEIGALYNKLQEGFDVVYGERKDKKFTFFKKVCSRIFLTILRLLIKEDIVVNTTIFRIMRRPVVDAVCQLRERHRYIIGLIGWVGFKHVGVSVYHDERTRGTTKYHFGRQLQLALDAVYAFSDYPLRLIIYSGFLIVCMSFLGVFYVVVRRYLWGVSVVGWTSVITAILFIGGSQIFFMGILGEYVGRSYLELKKRPLYIIETLLDEKK